LVFGIDGREPEDQLFLMLENEGDIQIRKTGDNFRSRDFQNGVFSPQVVFDFVKGDGDGDGDSAAPVEDVPTPAPTLSNPVPASATPGSNTTTPEPSAATAQSP
jgi:hypothetical protein